MEEDDLVLIRHGQSDFNKGFLDYTAIRNMQADWDHCITLPEFNEKVSYAKEHMDCHLTQEGKQQCAKAREQLKDISIDVVLVSPHQRALETCREIFGERGVRVEVHPIFAETFRYSCDISHQMEQKRAQFMNYDFSHMKDSSQLWFIDQLAKHHQETCAAHLGNGPLPYHQKQHRLLELLKSKTVFEAPQELRERVSKAKDILNEYRKKYKRIAVVSHFHVIRYLLSEGFDEEGEATIHPYVYNATPFFTSLTKILKIR